MATEESSYIDYDTFLAPDFSATAFANDLVLSTNDPTDTPLDLSTPLSRVLFDVQEVDIHIDNLTTKSAVPLLDYTQTRADASSNILDEVSAQLDSLNEGYRRLEKDVIERYEKAEQTRLAAERLCQTLRLGRVVARCMNLGRQLETQMEDLGISASSTSIPSSSSTKLRDHHRSMVAAANTILELRSILYASPPVPLLHKITNVTTLRNNLLNPLERHLTTLAQTVIREFSVSSLANSNAPAVTSPTSSLLSPTSATAPATATFNQLESTKARTTSALQTLYLLSPCPPGTGEDRFEPRLMLAALTSYLQANLTASQAGLARALATLPTLDRTLGEVGARCGNVVALEEVLRNARRGTHPNLKPFASATNGTSNGTERHDSDDDDDDSTSSSSDDEDAALEKQRSKQRSGPSDAPQKSKTLQRKDDPLLPLLLSSLDTNSLPSYFWRTLASNLTSRVIEILNRGGVSARTLKSNKERVAGAVRECVLKTPTAQARDRGGGEVKGWDREAAVMVGSIVGVLGR